MNFWKNKKVLITGGAGFIGSYVTKELIKRKSKITIVVSPKTTLEHLKQVFSSTLDKIIVEKVDLLVLNNFLKATKDQEIVLNFAALDGGAKYKLEHSAEIFWVNTQLVLNLLEACKINKPDRVLIMSSIDIYPQNAKSPIKEEDAHLNNFDENFNGYALSKIFSEVAAELYYKQYGLKIAIARPGNVYGPEDFSGKDRGRAIPTFIDKIRHNQNIIIWGSGLQKNSYLYVSDLVRALLNLVEKYSVGEPVNIAGKKITSLTELAKTIIGLSNGKNKIEFTDTSVSNFSDKIVDIKKAKKVINFKELVSLSEGVSNTIKYK